MSTRARTAPLAALISDLAETSFESGAAAHRGESQARIKRERAGRRRDAVLTRSRELLQSLAAMSDLAAEAVSAREHSDDPADQELLEIYRTQLREARRILRAG